jgi:hypothetical protein
MVGKVGKVGKLKNKLESFSKQHTRLLRENAPIEKGGKLAHLAQEAATSMKTICYPGKGLGKGTCVAQAKSYKL